MYPPLKVRDASGTQDFIVQKVSVDLKIWDPKAMMMTEAGSGERCCMCVLVFHLNISLSLSYICVFVSEYI